MSVNKILNILVEGSQDEYFVERIVKPWLISKGKCKDINTFMYARRKREIVENYIEATLEKEEEILCLTDSTHAPCISGRIEDLINNEIGHFDRKAIIVAVKEIESWYLAGVDYQCCRRLRIEYVPKTENVKKEGFHSIIARSKYRNRQACKAEMLRNFNIQLASERNASFNRLYRKYLV